MTFVKLTFTEIQSQIKIDIVVPDYNIQEFYLHDVTKAARYYRGHFVESEIVNSCSISVRTELPIAVRTELPIALSEYEFLNGYELSEICVYDTNRDNEPIVRRQYTVRREPLCSNSFADGVLTISKPRSY